jgi:UDP-2,3-diacylglucosamine pyrophosphatase LpxH
LSGLPELAGDVILTADVHLGESDGRYPAFLALLEKYRTLPVVVLGDLFSYWYERWGKVPTRYRPFLADIVKLNRSAPVYLIPGNRDLLAGKTLTKLTNGAVIVTPGFIPLPKRGVVLTHGDLLTRWDSHYRFYRFMLSSGLMALFARLIPEFLAEKVVFGLRNMSAAEKRRAGEKLLGLELSVAEKLYTQDIDGLICGHFHPEYLLTYRGQRHWIKILPDWGTAPGSHMILTEPGATEYRPAT